MLRCLKELEASARNLYDYRNLRAQIETIFSLSKYGIWVLDGEGVVLRVNKVALRLIGLKKKDVLGKKISDLADKGVINEALTPTILKERRAVTMPLYVIKSKKYLMASGKPIFDDQGNIIMVIVFEHDMTIVKELKDQLELTKSVTETVKNELSHINLLELGSEDFIANTPEMKQVMNISLKLAKLDVSNILITGESGTGKGQLVKLIHRYGHRSKAPFIAINCAALPEMLLEAELFGYEKGAFTGASDNGKAGLFELANEGTIFLDEIGDLPLSVQAKLLKCLDEKEIRRVGGTRAIPVNCTVIAATNQNMELLLDNKRFRQDLYYRLNAFPISIPPLRKRPEDILELTTHFLKIFNKKYKQKKRLSQNALESIETYDFPGNIRELKNLVRNAVVINENDVIDNLLPKIDLSQSSQLRKNTRKIAAVHKEEGLNEAVLKIERRKLIEAMKHSTNTREAARYLKVSQATVTRKLKKHGLSF
jgi:PAS domain S-box-containing protein